MATDNNAPHIVPWWIYLIIIVCMIPGLSYPLQSTLAASTDATVRGLTWFYPVYTLVSGLLAWMCYGRRTLLTWILLAMLILSHISFYYMAFTLQQVNIYR